MDFKNLDEFLDSKYFFKTWNTHRPGEQSVCALHCHWQFFVNKAEFIIAQ